MKRKELLVAMSLLFAACGQKSVETVTGVDRIDLSTCAGSVDEKIKTISVVNLDVDDSWSYINQSRMTMTANRYVFVHRYAKRLLMYDLKGKKVVDRSIQGRGPGELNSVENVFSQDNRVYCFDDGDGTLVSYDEKGKYVSKLTFEDGADYVYGLGDGFIGLSNFRDDYVYVYDKEIKRTGSFLELDEFFKYNSSSFGLNPTSYVFRDSLRFIMSHDYTIYSLSDGEFTPRFEFVAENPIPSSFYKKHEGMHQNALDMSSDLAKGGYDYGFCSLAETDRYLVFEYFSSVNGTKTCLFDKRYKTLYKSFVPKRFVDVENASDVTADDVWQNLIYYLIPTYSDGESVYFRISKDIYQVLKSSQDKLDDRQKSLYRDITRYMTRNTLSDGDLLILRVEFE